MKNKYRAAIDLGTNSCRLLIADNEGNYICKKNVKTALGEGLYKEMKFTPEAVKRGVDCLCDFAKEIEKYQPCKLRAIATAGCRMAQNADEFLKKVKETSGVELEVIDGLEEARLNLKGASVNVKGKAPYVLIYDIGGGSTEVTLAENDKNLKILHSISMPWGARNAAEAFLINNYEADKAKKLRRELAEYLNNFAQDCHWDEYHDKTCCVATSSTPLRLAAMIEDSGDYDRESLDGYVLKTSKTEKKIKEVWNTDEQTRADSPYIGKKRAPIFVAGCIIFQTIYKKLDLKEITASLKSAKDGIIEELGEKNDKVNKVCTKSQWSPRSDCSR